MRRSSLHSCFLVALIILMLFFSQQSLQAQQRPHYTQYVINPFIINPAIAGIDNYGDLKISGRDQWAGLSGAPRTTYLTLHAPIGKNDYRTSSTLLPYPETIPEAEPIGKIIQRPIRIMVQASVLSMIVPVVLIFYQPVPAMPITSALIQPPICQQVYRPVLLLFV